ncbi:hypothetical protein J2S50_006961 [Streptomyces sp. DSM 40167]|nr:hypothetical protein [Streptomyces sp. DSM 40167]
MSDSMWQYQPTTGHIQGTDLTGFKVEARDGDIGKVAKHSKEAGDQYIVVNIGVWIFGKEVLLPAGTVVAVNTDERLIQVSRTKDEIKSAPDFDKDEHLGDPGYHERIGHHYGHARDMHGTPHTGVAHGTPTPRAAQGAPGTGTPSSPTGL